MIPDKINKNLNSKKENSSNVMNSRLQPQPQNSGLVTNVTSTQTANPSNSLSLFGNSLGPQPLVQSGGLFGTMATNRGTSITPFPTGSCWGRTSLFGQSTTQTTNTPTSAAQSSGLFGSIASTSQMQTGGLFGNPVSGRGLFASINSAENFGSAPQISFFGGVPPNQPQSQSGFASANINSAAHTTSSPLKPDDFGFNRYIQWPKSPGIFIPGIPRTEPFDINTTERIQRALLNLCLLAENKCWPALFNDAVECYIRGELNLYRQIPVAHVDLIYDRAHSESR